MNIVSETTKDTKPLEGAANWISKQLDWNIPADLQIIVTDNFDQTCSKQEPTYTGPHSSRRQAVTSSRTMYIHDKRTVILESGALELSEQALRGKVVRAFAYSRQRELSYSNDINNTLNWAIQNLGTDITEPLVIDIWWVLKDLSRDYFIVQNFANEMWADTRHSSLREISQRIFAQPDRSSIPFEANTYSRTVVPFQNTQLANATTEFADAQWGAITRETKETFVNAYSTFKNPPEQPVMKQIYKELVKASLPYI
jgi:hypothetical protein